MPANSSSVGVFSALANNQTIAAKLGVHATITPSKNDSIALIEGSLRRLRILSQRFSFLLSFFFSYCSPPNSEHLHKLKNKSGIIENIPRKVGFLKPKRAEGFTRRPSLFLATPPPLMARFGSRRQMSRQHQVRKGKDRDCDAVSREFSVDQQHRDCRNPTTVNLTSN